MWDVSTTLVFSRPSTKLHSASKNNSVSTVPTSTPPISTKARDEQNTDNVSGMNASADSGQGTGVWLIGAERQ